MKKQCILVTLAVALLSSCSHRLVDFTVISSRNVPITESGTEFKKATQRVQGSDSKWSILFIPGIPNMKEAIDKAIDKYPGAVALTDGVVYSKSWSVGLFGQNKYVVEGTPLYTQAGADSFIRSNNGVPEYVTPAAPYNKQSKEVMRVQHTVEPGETLSTIASSYNVTVANIMKWNNLKSNKITTGSKLTIYIEE